MSKVSKTAKASEVKEAKTAKAALPDYELIRLLRIDRASGLYPGTQGVDALLRLYDNALLVIQVMDRKILDLESVNSAYQLDAIDEAIDSVIGQRAENDLTSVCARMAIAIRTVRENVKNEAASLIKTKGIFHGDQNGGYTAPSNDAEELSAAVQAL